MVGLELEPNQQSDYSNYRNYLSDHPLSRPAFAIIFLAHHQLSKAPEHLATFVGKLVMLKSTFKVIWSSNSGVRSTEKRNPLYFLRNKRSQGESVTALRKVPRKQPTACQQHLLHLKDKPPAL